MRKITIVHVIGNLTLGGAERFVIDLCNELAKDDRYVLHLVSLSANPGSNDFLNEISTAVSYISFHKPPGFSLTVLLKFTRWLKTVQPDVVHSHLNAFEYLMPYGAISSTPFFHTIHNVAQLECPDGLIKGMRWLFYRSGRALPVTISADGRRTFREYYGLDTDVLIENGRPEPVLTAGRDALALQYRGSRAAGADELLLVHVGRIAAEKNQLLLIRAVQLFNKTETKRCRLLMIGLVQDVQCYAALQLEAGDDPCILFLGGRKNVADYLSIADLFCLSSRYEGMPISLIESFSLGCIPVCSPAGGIPDMIREGITGFISHDLTVPAYKAALKKAAFHAQPAAMQSALKAEFSSRYHIRIAVKAYVRAYKKALGTKRVLQARMDDYTYQN